jgi:excisionase family DNA binding protein
MKDRGKFAMNKKRVTLKQMADHLNRCEKTFRKYVLEYKIPHIRLGRDMLFDTEEVESFLLNLTMSGEQSLVFENSKKTKNSSVKKNLSNQNKSQNKYANLLGIS